MHIAYSLQGENVFLSKLFSCYLAAIVHDYEHRGVNNDFLIKTGDPLALLYNDVSPMENHHVAASFILMQEEQYAFFSVPNKRVRTEAVAGEGGAYKYISPIIMSNDTGR